MVNGFIDIKALTLEELNGVINLYPWYGGARMELCRRMSELGEGAWSDERYADAALYIGSRRLVAKLARAGRREDYSDESVKELLRSYMAPEGKSDRMEEVRKTYRGVGDYFSGEEYRNARHEDDNIFSSFAKSAKDTANADLSPEDMSDYYTETLAEIYLEQGYAEQAKDIYSQLSLRYPEKSVYFASLIEKINNN